MSDYEPLEGTQGDPWSTEPAGEPPRNRRQPETEGYDESQVLARVPDVADDTAVESHRQYGHSSSHRRRRAPSRRPGVPAPVWIVLGAALVVIIALPFIWSGQSGNETAVEGPDVWHEPLAPDADVAPAWASANTANQWQQPDAWPQESATAATVEPQPAAPGAWNSTPPTEGWVGAPTRAPYGYNAADGPTQTAPSQSELQLAPGVGPGIPIAPPIAAQTPTTGWDTSIPPALPSRTAEPSYQQPSYPPVAGTETPSWSANAVTPPQTSSVPYDATQPTPPTNSWGHPVPSLATPQPETVMPGYGSYPAAQQNPYAGNSADGATNHRGDYTVAPPTPGTPPAYPHSAPNYPVAGQPAPRDPYAVPAYPRTAMNPNTAAPASNPIGRTPSYGTQPAPPATNYPPAARNPYAPQATPAAPAAQPYYGTGASTGTPQHSVARLNGTIQEPAARTAYDDRAGPIFY